MEFLLRLGVLCDEDDSEERVSRLALFAEQLLADSTLLTTVHARLPPAVLDSF